jgi:ubiquinone/menaquinone biosynthesis C-methylase UbiE
MEIEKISNIEIIRSDVETKIGSKLSDDAVDLVLMTNLLFEIEDKKGVLEEGKRVLRKGGKILVVDWKPESPLGPVENRVSPAKVKEIAKELNLKLENEFEAGLYHYGLLFARP